MTKAKMLFAKWQVAVSVQLKVEGAAEPAWTATYVVDENGTLGDEAIAEMIAALAEVQDENDTFGNWWVRSADRNFTAEDLTTVSFSAADEIIGTVTKVHVVTFYLDDAAEAPVVTYEVTQKDGQDTLTNEQLAELMALEDDKVGYVFAGWADAQGITYPYTRNLGSIHFTDNVTFTAQWKAAALNLKEATVEVQESATYTGSAIEPTVTVTLANGTELMKDQDYTVSYGSDQAPINVGTYTVVVAGIGDYRGAVEAQFVINPVNLENASITYIPTQDVNEDGSPVEPAVEVKIGDTVVDSANYDVVYENNTTEGTATVTVTGKAPNYTGSTSTTFEIKGMRYYVYGQATYNNGSIAANQSISLTGTTADGESVNMTTKTDRNGNFRFDDLKDGTYYVVWAGKNFPANLNAYEDDAN